MTSLQLKELGKVIRRLSPVDKLRMTIYKHGLTEEKVTKFMKGLPKKFCIKTSVEAQSTCDSLWQEATASKIYGLGDLEITMFYPKEEGGDK